MAIVMNNIFFINLCYVVGGVEVVSLIVDGILIETGVLLGAVSAGSVATVGVDVVFTIGA